MIKYTPSSERSLALFRTPFQQQLDPDNRWVKMAELVPWDSMAKVFFDHMSPDQGRASIDLRIVLGALLVKHIEGLSDEDTIRYIQENIYAQYFVGLPSFQTEPVFVPSLFVEIRKRLGKNGATRLNDQVLAQAQRIEALRHRPRRKVTKKKPDDNQDQGPPQDTDANPSAQEQADDSQADTPTKRGTLKMDASVAPQHIGYPTDTRLLAEARQYSEELIDKLYYGSSLWSKKRLFAK